MILNCLSKTKETFNNNNNNNNNTNNSEVTAEIRARNFLRVLKLKTVAISATLLGESICVYVLPNYDKKWPTDLITYLLMPLLTILIFLWNPLF
jgi:hypothetical protein